MKNEEAWAGYRRQWRRVHLGIEATTLEMQAIEVTDNATGDAPMLSCLLNQIADDEPIASLNDDGTDDTKDIHEAIARRGVEAIIPRPRNPKPFEILPRG